MAGHNYDYVRDRRASSFLRDPKGFFIVDIHREKKKTWEIPERCLPECMKEYTDQAQHDIIIIIGSGTGMSGHKAERSFRRDRRKKDPISQGEITHEQTKKQKTVRQWFAWILCICIFLVNAGVMDTVLAKDGRNRIRETTASSSDAEPTTEEIETTAGETEAETI